MKSKLELKQAFALAFSNGLLMRFRELPSAAFIAKEFNLRTPGMEPISQESARRWLRGLAIPEFDKLLVLRSWLDLDLNALGMPSVETTQRKDNQYQEALLENQNDFIKTTRSIKQSLKLLMDEVEKLEAKIERKD